MYRQLQLYVAEVAGAVLEPPPARGALGVLVLHIRTLRHAFIRVVVCIFIDIVYTMRVYM